MNFKMGIRWERSKRQIDFEGPITLVVRKNELYIFDSYATNKKMTFDI